MARWCIPLMGSPARGAVAQATQSSAEGRLAVGRDGTVYYDDYWNLAGTNRYFIRKVAPDGLIYTVAGQAGSLADWGQWRSQMGVKAEAAQLTPVMARRVGPDGVLYVSPEPEGQYGIGGVYKITPDGVLGMVMNSVPFPSVGWKTSARETTAPTRRPSPLPTGALGRTTSRSRRMAPWTSRKPTATDPPPFGASPPAAYLQRLAGRGPETTVSAPYPPSQQGANPLQACSEAAAVCGWPWRRPHHPGPCERCGLRRERLDCRLHRGELQIPADDGTELYVFAANGLHLRTLDGLTGATNWSFGYDADNLVTQLRDANGLTTTVERAAGGQPTAIVGPYGQRTTLALDAGGHLSRVTNPLGESTLLTNTPGGLLTSIAGPLNHTYTIAYDADGLVTQTADPLGGGLSLTVVTNTGISIVATATSTLASVDLRELYLWPSGYTPEQPPANWNLGGGNSGHQRLRVAALRRKQLRQPRLHRRPALPRANTPACQPNVVAPRLPGAPPSTLHDAATLSDLNNPFSIVTLSNQTTFNGQAYTMIYTGFEPRGGDHHAQGRQVPPWA